jgi:hypothetical protein
MKGKQRLSASADAELVKAGQSAVDEGRAESMSAWVNEAFRLKAEHDRRMRALDTLLSAYESDHGEITDGEIKTAVRRTRALATVVRGHPVGDQARPGRARGAG